MRSRRAVMRRPGRSDEIGRIAAGMRLAPDGPLMTLLRADPTAALRIGECIERHGERHRAAFPGQSRLPRFTAADFDKAGHRTIAEAMRLMALDRF